MGGIPGILLSSAGALSLDRQEVNTIQNTLVPNPIANALAPEYADQNPALVAQSFDPDRAASGGVMSAGVISSRSEYLQQNVRNQQTLLGASQQTATDLAQVQ